MRLRTQLTHAFVEHVPERLEEGVLYVSIRFATAVHLCACGCGEEVVTPLSPADWRLVFDGKTVSLYPSIGSWNLPCRSHYWIERDRVRRAPSWTDDEVAEGRRLDAERRARYFAGQISPADDLEWDDEPGRADPPDPASERPSAT